MTITDLERITDKLSAVSKPALNLKANTLVNKHFFRILINAFIFLDLLDLSKDLEKIKFISHLLQ